MLPCAVPYPAARCLGWDVALGATRCGQGYLQGSYLCGLCASGFFLQVGVRASPARGVLVTMQRTPPQDDGTCVTCPVLKSAWDRYRGLLYIIIVIFAGVTAVWTGLLLLVRLRGGTLIGGALRMVDLAVWGLLSAQVWRSL